MIVVQAGAAARVLEGDQPHVRDALEAIETTGRATVDEMRRLLGVLRRSDDGLALAAAGPRRTRAVLANVREAGLQVDLRVEGAPSRLPPGLDLTAYRIAQEALTNTVKHAGPARAELTVRYEASAVEIEVRDDGAARERVRRRSRTDRDERAGGALGRPDRGRPHRRRLARARAAAARGLGVISVLLADDQALVRAGFALILNAEPEIEVVGRPATAVRRSARAECRPRSC